MSHRISPARPHIGPLALLGRRVLEVPQAQEAHDRSGGEDRAGQEQGELETPEKGGHRQVECVLACGRGGDVDLALPATRSPGLGLPAAARPGGEIRPGGASRPGSHRGAETSIPRMASPVAVPIWREALNRPDPIPDDPSGTSAIAADATCRDHQGKADPHQDVAGGRPGKRRRRLRQLAHAKHARRGDEAPGPDGRCHRQPPLYPLAEPGHGKVPTQKKARTGRCAARTIRQRSGRRG